MTGTLKEGESLSEGALIDWFPVQSPEAWDYLFQYVITNPKEFVDRFYFQFGDLSDRALNAEEELALWDYFAADEFRPVITSRVPVGSSGQIVSFQVDESEIAAKFKISVTYWMRGLEKLDVKWRFRTNYFLTFLHCLRADYHFTELDIDGDLASRAGYLIDKLFGLVCKPIFDEEKIPLDEIVLRKKVIDELFLKLDQLDMAPAMKACWENAKSKRNTI
jgi:hypothetical protein